MIFSRAKVRSFFIFSKHSYLPPPNNLSRMEKQPKWSRSASFALVTLSYVLALVLAGAAAWYGQQKGYDILLVTLAADIVGTAVVFVFSYIFRNSSFYDPYWSVVPPIIGLYWAATAWEQGVDPIRIILSLSLVFFWGFRLTANWVRGFPGLHHQDWRYTVLQGQTGRWYWLVSFLGIHLFPTLMVFLGCLPLYPALSSPESAFNLLDVAGLLLTLTGILLELISDNQRYRYAQQPDSAHKTFTGGLWKYSRHPNYLGEITFWTGLYLFALAAGWNWWWTGIGWVAMAAMFVFITIPMMEKRQLARRPDYHDIMKRIPMLLPGRRRG